MSVTTRHVILYLYNECFNAVSKEQEGTPRKEAARSPSISLWLELEVAAGVWHAPTNSKFIVANTENHS